MQAASPANGGERQLVQQQHQQPGGEAGRQLAQCPAPGPTAQHLLAHIARTPKAGKEPTCGSWLRLPGPHPDAPVPGDAGDHDNTAACLLPEEPAMASNMQSRLHGCSTLQGITNGSHQCTNPGQAPTVSDGSSQGTEVHASDTGRSQDNPSSVNALLEEPFLRVQSLVGAPLKRGGALMGQLLDALRCHSLSPAETTALVARHQHQQHLGRHGRASSPQVSAVG